MWNKELIIKFVKENQLLLLIVIVGFFLRIYKLDFQSVWIDEIFSLIHGDPTKSYMEIYRFIRLYDPHPPLYYFSLHFFFELFGESTFAARFLSVLYGVGGMISVFFLTKELFNKKTALIATLLVAVNIFHISYSQDARMYTLLFLTTTMSFYFLVRFIKLPSLKQALIFGFVAALMIYSHFYALFTLFAQYLILLYFLLSSFRADGKKFFLYCLASAILTLILYIPAIFVLVETMRMSSIWIPMPEPDNFTQMFKEFFGKAEIVLYFMILGLLIFFVRLSNNTQSGIYIDPLKDRWNFAFLVCTVWILITYFIPLILSYINLPMLVSRYFISFLPALIILISAGIASVRNTILAWVTMILIVIFSMTSLFIEKDYYGKISKTQWRELTYEIKARNINGARVVMYWHWLMPYFFKDSPQIPISGQSLDEYLASVRSGKMPKESFWYMDGHVRKFEPSPADQEFLNQNYILKDQIDLWDCWARYYEPIGAPARADNIGVWSFKPANLDDKGQIVLFNNAILKTRPYHIKKGNYELIVKGKSTPEVPIDNENAHVIITMNTQKIADFRISENPAGTEYRFPIEIQADSKVRFMIEYDNDKMIKNEDRNLILSEFNFKKK